MIEVSDLELALVQGLIEAKQPFWESMKHGGYAEVFGLGENYVVKVLFQQYKNRGIDYEFEIAQELYAAGISVPRPIGLFDAEVNREGIVKTEKGFVMERLLDVASCGEDGNKNRELGRRLEGLLKQCCELGFFPIDHHWTEWGGHNVAYNPEEDQLYLFDFDQWERMDVRDIFYLLER
ncbi:hypothetical protein GOV03_00050 [Candidatus Woesearchaeota archaeon]|nr:hypothetical protein [Candidatus Woesearchaeota archaeon]